MMAELDRRWNRRSRTRLLGPGLLLVGLLAAFAAFPWAGAAAEARGLVAVASAQGFRMNYTVPEYVVVEEFFDGGGPVAQATVDTTGRSVAFASLPYPGENAVTFPGVLAVALGMPIPFDYPFYAKADYPVTPEAEVRDPSGSYSLKATADRRQAAGLADIRLGGTESPVSSSSAHSTAVSDADGKTRVVAETVSTGLSFGDGVLRIASVRSRSVTTYTPGEAEPATTTELLVEGANVGGQPVTIGPDGVKPGGQTVPVPIGESTQSLNQALAESGLSVRTISGDPVEGGSAGDVLVVTSKHTYPVSGNPQGTLVMRFGGATTAITLGTDVGFLPEAPAVPEAPAAPEAPPLPAAPEVAASAPPAPPAEAPAEVPAAADEAVPLPAEVPSLESFVPASPPAEAAPAPPASPPAPAQDETALLVGNARDSMRAIFAIFGLAGAALASFAIVSAKGV